MNFQDLKGKILSETPLITPHELHHHLNLKNEQKYITIDVREENETRQGIIPKSHMVPRGRLEMEIETLSPQKETTIVLYCASGVRSAFAVRSLRELGYQSLFSLQGGFQAWKERQLPIEKVTQLTPQQEERYSRHLRLAGFGIRGQKKLLQSSVLIVGAGGLGSSAALYLAAAGIGHLGIIDKDLVDLSNLQRQILHSEDTIGTPKVDSAFQRLERLNSDIHIEVFNDCITPENVGTHLKGWDVVIDATDSISIKYVLNDYCVEHSIPYVWSSIRLFKGQLMVVTPGNACYRTLFPTPPDASTIGSCDSLGVLGVLPGVMGTLQANEAIKYLTGIGELIENQLLMVDLEKMEFHKFYL